MGYISPMLAVRDMKQTVQFYRDSLGFKVGMTFPDVDNPEYADLSKDGMVLMFIAAGNIGIGREAELGAGVSVTLAPGVLHVCTGSVATEPQSLGMAFAARHMALGSEFAIRTVRFPEGS